MNKFQCVYDCEGVIDGFDVESLGAGIKAALDILTHWMDMAHAEGMDDEENWNYMIQNGSVWVVKYDPDDLCFDDIVWEPSETVLEAIGWVYKEEEDE